MTPLRTIIADDEFWAIKRLETQLRSINGVNLIGAATDGEQASRLIAEHTPDLVVLDIKMPVTNGIEVLRALPRQSAPEVVFVTAFEEFAPAAFEIDAVDYLLKPIERERLVQALDRVRKRREAHAATERAADLEHVLEAMRQDRREKVGGRHECELWVRQAGRSIRIDIEQVDWFESERDYVIIHMGDKTITMRQSLSQLMKTLDPSKFIRVHRSALVRRTFVKAVERKKGRANAIILTNGLRLPIGTTYSVAVSQVMRRP